MQHYAISKTRRALLNVKLVNCSDAHDTECDMKSDAATGDYSRGKSTEYYAR